MSENIEIMFLNFLCIICLCTADIRASNHWMVTETGLIQPKDDSSFVMSRPFDLLAFLNQETRWENIFNIYDFLIIRQDTINNLWARLEIESDVTKQMAENEHCEAVGSLEMIDWYTSFLEDGRFKGIPDEEFMHHQYNSDYGDTDIPDCKKISSLTFSMFAFEHLDGMINRENLNATPEFALPELFSTIMTVDQFGHWLSDILRKNSSSWLHYNLAAIYWRVRGNVPKALECSRRAVHYAPRNYKNIALLCMGSILHRSKKTDDAVVVLGAAVDHDPYFPISHFALGGAYAVVGDFNSSMRHLDISTKLHKKFELAEKFRNGVLCHMDLLTKMQIAQTTLDKLSKELAEYTKMEILWLKIQTAFLKTMKHEDEYDYKNVEKNCQKMSDITGLKIRDLKKDGDRNSLVQYFIDSPTYNEEWKKEKGVAALDIAHSLQKIVKHIGRHAGLPTKSLLTPNTPMRNGTQVLKEIGPMPAFPDMFPDSNKYKPHIKTAEIKIEHQLPEIRPEDIEMGILKPDTGRLLYPSNMKVNRNKEDFDTDPEWPSNMFCKEAAPKFPENVETIYPVFLPFENKGIRLNSLLTKKIGVPASEEHELPWHPPVCPTDKDTSLYTQKKGIKVQLISESISTEYLRGRLLRYLSESNYDLVKNMQDAEIGQRIYTATQKKLASKWVLYTLSSLYWRVRGNLPNALNCLLTASRTADTRYKDVVLVSVASVLLEMGFVDDSAVTIEEAYRLSPYEPPTNFVLAQINTIKKNQKAYMFHLKQVVRVEPNFMNGIPRNLLNAWSCILKQVNTLRELGEIEGNKELCAEVQPGVSMVCERDGTNCHMLHTHCGSGQKRGLFFTESSTLVRLLELKDDNIQGAPVEEFDDTFTSLHNIMHIERSDKLAHQKNYDSMVKTVADMIDACGYKGCSGIQAEDLDLKEEECGYQHLQLDYWLHIVSFRQQLSDADFGLPAEVTGMTPSHKKVPECRIPLDPTEDFYVERMMRVDTSGWEPALSLIHQFAELFRFYDYATLGAKIARYVDTYPTSWVGAVAAGWWCGAGGRGACAARCLGAAHALAPPSARIHALRLLPALLHMQSKPDDAKDIAYLAFYSSPKSKIEAFLVAVSHTYKAEYDQAVWMYRYALSLDEKFLPAKACLHITMCLMLFGDNAKKKSNENPA